MDLPPTSLPATGLATLDCVVIGVYMLVLMGMGILFRKSATKNLESFFLAGRRMPGWLNGVSYAATCMNADVAPAYCGMTVISGLFICWWYISRFGLALMIGGVLFAVFWRRLALNTSPEFYELRFRGTTGLTMRTWIAMRSAFIALVAWTGAGLLGMHKVAEPLLGWDRWTTFAVCLPVILFYVLLSGYVGVVWSDFFQTLVHIAAALVMMAAVLIDFGGPQGLHDSLLRQFGPEVVSWVPPASHEWLGIVGIIAWTMGTAIGYGGDAAPMSGAMEGQRILSCKNGREAAKMYVWTQAVLFFLLVTLTLPALGAVAKWPGLRDGAINKELAFGMLLQHYMPTGLLGLAISGILASIMATVSSNMNFGAQVFINDVYARSLYRTGTQRHYLMVGRLVAAAILGLAVLVATTAQNVIDISVFMLGLSSAELTANWAQWWWWRFNGPARLAASFGGPVVFLLNKFVIFKSLVHADSSADYLVVLTSMAATCVLWIVVALATKPDDEQQLITFYLRTRPLGFWGPIARKAGLPSADGNPILRGLLIAATGAIMVAAATVAVSCLYVGNWDLAASAAIISVFAGLFFKRGFQGFMERIHADA